MHERMKSGIWAIAVIIAIVLILTFVLKPLLLDTESLPFKKKTVTMISEDGAELSADLYQPDSDNKKEKFPGLILLSPFGESREIYTDMAHELCKNNFVVLSVDVRNSGESKIDNESFVESIANLGLDADTAVYFLLEQSNVKPDKIAILGTGMTARSALMIKDLNNKINAAVLVSAVMDSAGYNAIEESPDCPILVLVSIQDVHAASQALDIRQTSQNPASKIETYFNAGSGSDLWRSHAKFDMMSTIANWLTKVLKES
jgi:dienelactone hydrolase